MLKYKPRTIYQVNYQGQEEKLFYSVSAALHYVGFRANGERTFGSMLVTARQAFDAGFTIGQYKEFL